MGAACTTRSSPGRNQLLSDEISPVRVGANISALETRCVRAANGAGDEATGKDFDGSNGAGVTNPRIGQFSCDMRMCFVVGR